MNDLNDLEARLKAATETVRAALSNKQTAGPAAGDETVRIAALEAQNTALTGSLEKLKKQRGRDMAELDTLIARLKPLVEEVD